MWIQLLLAIFIGVVDTVVHLRESSWEVNAEKMMHGSLTLLHILDAGALTDFCLGPKQARFLCSVVNAGCLSRASQALVLTTPL